MRWPLLFSLLALAGCHLLQDDGPLDVEAHVAAVAPVHVTLGFQPCAGAEPEPLPAGPLDLPAFWQLALAHNPSLREAAAELEAAHGKRIQASKYPNPRVTFHTEELGSRLGPPGTPSVQVSQEIVTGCKRLLDMKVADRQIGVAEAGLLARKFDVLTRIRRAYYNFVNLDALSRVQDQVVTTLEESVEITRTQVEVIKDRPRADLLRLQALLEDARASRTRARLNRDAAWRELAAEVGLPCLALPAAPLRLPQVAQPWDPATVNQRVLAASSELRQAGLEVEHARLEVERARAEAFPNVHVAGGYIRNYIENTAGAVVNVETALPLWDRKQGLIHEAQARLARAQAAEHSLALRLQRDTADALARYQGAREQVERLTREVLPRLEESLKLVRQAYQAGARQLSFADVQLAIEAVNDARLRQATIRRDLWQALADLQGLMQLDIDEDDASSCVPAAATLP
jgi:cobalt-zinc-cadmium efflux system outer membrane protein